jgi:hypothetical protein
MKKIFLAMAIAFAITTAMTITTVGSVFRLGICEPFGKRFIKGRKVT